MAGNQTRVQGAILEGNLDELLHPRYLADGEALVWKAGTVAEHHNGRWQPVRSLPDYHAVLMKGNNKGQYVCFDAKTTKGDTYTHSKKAMHQCQHLYRVYRAGGAAFILVHRLDNDTGWLLYPMAHWALDSGWSIRLERREGHIDIDPCPKWAGVHEYIPDWYSLVVAGYNWGR